MEKTLANRSYLYSFHPNEENRVRDLSEWRSMPPVSHFMLVGVNPEPVKSEIWTVDEKIAIRGDAPAAAELFFRFLDWFGPQVEGAEADIEEAKKALRRDDRKGEKYHLELGEVYELSGYELPQMELEAVNDSARAAEVVAEVREILETKDSTIADFKNMYLCDAAQDWQRDLGLYFPGILYFHMG